MQRAKNVDWMTKKTSNCQKCRYKLVLFLLNKQEKKEVLIIILLYHYYLFHIKTYNHLYYY